MLIQYEPELHRVRILTLKSLIQKDIQQRLLSFTNTIFGFKHVYGQSGKELKRVKIFFDQRLFL